MKKFLLNTADFTKSKILLRVICFFYLEYTNQYLKFLSRKYGIKRFEGFDQNIEIAFLGSGGSINKISNTRWEKIEQKITIGPNGWMFSEKRADYYTLEGRNGVIQEPFLTEFKTVLSNESVKFNGTTILIHVSAVKSIETLRAASASSVDFLLYGHVKPLTLSKDRLAATLREMLILCRFERYQGIAIGKGATLERVISLSITSEAKGLLLAGVDLYNRATFYEKNKGLVSRLGINVGDLKKGVHKTNDPAMKRFTITEMILAFKIASGRSNDFMKIESSKSALARLLPKWN